ncbi:MAG TPA: hypothetical protein VLX92_17860 [Kofleriaceae bacterium]|nr:hypothetical protein [Kofleriaceae bacterium]
MRIVCLSLLVYLVACGHDPKSAGDDDTTLPDAAGSAVQGDPLQGLPSGTAEWAAVCAQHYGDMISAKFCAGSAPPALTSLADLEQLLGLQPSATNTNVKFTLNGESTGIGMRSVTQLNPRAFIMTAPLSGGGPNQSYEVLSFARGEPMVELVANDPVAKTLRFFLVRFYPACEPSCTNADRYTPAIESGWTGYTIYDDATIKDTTLDCLACHQPGGPGTPKILRMQELQNPWGHWFYPERPQTATLVNDFMAAHGNESYAGIPAALVTPSRPFVLMQLVQNNGFSTQPNVYNTLTIENEIAASGQSATWNALYAASVAGTAIPTPYYATPATDETIVQADIAAYNQVMAGTLPPDQLPDFSQAYPAAALPFMSVQPAAGLDGQGILVHMCRMCHNPTLDQTISRANFDIDHLATMSRAEKDLAIQRLQLPDGDVHQMPPVRFHELSQAERDLAIGVLAQ